MKKNLLLFALFYSFFCFSQNETTQTFKSNNETFTYKELDYSKYGVVQFFVYFYESNEQNANIYKNAIGCLNKEYNIYHTFYYFVEIPKGHTELEKENIFADFMNQITMKRNFDSDNIYINFDINYSRKYLEDLQNSNSKSKIKRIVIELTPKTVCRTLHIDRN